MLEAVGFFSEISKELTNHRISSNCVAGYYHDHIFVKIGEEQSVLNILNQMKNSYK